MGTDAMQGRWVVIASFAIAFLLTVYPLPRDVMWLRPDFVSLVLIYWVIALPQRIGIVVAFGVGVLLDILEGGVLGQNALSLSVVAYLGLILYQRLRVFSPWQQASVVFAMVGINHIVATWIHNLVGVSTSGPTFLVPVLLTALLWPAVLYLLRHLRRVYRVG